MDSGYPVLLDNELIQANIKEMCTPDSKKMGQNETVE